MRFKEIENLCSNCSITQKHLSRGLCRKCYYLSMRERILKYKKKYYQANTKKVNTRNKLTYEKCKEKILANKKKYHIDNKKVKNEYSRAYYYQNRNSIIKHNLQYIIDRSKTDIMFKISRNIRTRLYSAIKNNHKSGSAVNDLGCTIPELKKHLESQFKTRMSWSNYGKWHIDHIKPLSSFNLSNTRELKRACHYANLQPLWAKDNLKKGSR